MRDITPRQHVPHRPPYEAPYRQFIAASLFFALGGGFLLAILLPLARTLDWAWGLTVRWNEMVQLHGQLQLIGFAGLFVIGMALRLVPRVSGRHHAFRPLIPTLIPAIAGSLLLRAVLHPLDDGGLRDTLLVLSAALLLAGSLGFAAVVWGTLVHRDSRADATGYFFVLGAAGLIAGSVINAVQAWEMVRDSLATAPAARQTAQLYVQQFGFLLLFLGGVGSRAIPVLTGQPRRLLAPRIAAIILAVGVSLFAASWLAAAEGKTGTAVVRTGALGLTLTGVASALIVWVSGALSPRTRVAAASRFQFWFVRTAFAWLGVSALLALWFGARAFVDADTLDQYEIDAVRHAVTVGVLTSVIIGMAMLIVPEFAGRRLQHPAEAWLHVAMVAALNIAAALRLWPALEGVGWIDDTRFWPMAISGSLATVVVLAFALMFIQSWWEQRDPSWSARAAGLAPSGPD